LDYWQHLEWEIADDWEDLLQRLAGVRAGGNLGAGTEQGERLVHEAASNQVPVSFFPLRFWFFSKKARNEYTQVRYQRGDTLVFGDESRGLPESLLSAHADATLRIPIRPQVRSLNLSVSVGIVAYEARRQIEEAGQRLWS
jgi:tRNA (cytidine/uridine-2'-O-)-methyltransferase